MPEPPRPGCCVYDLVDIDEVCIGRLGDKAEYLTKPALFLLLNVFLPLLRFRKN